MTLIPTEESKKTLDLLKENIRLQDKNAELVKMLEDVKGYLGSDKRNEVDTLLTKHNHLNKKP